MILILQTLVGFFLTYVVGSRLSAHWQQRASNQTRYHEALILHRAEMVRATTILADLVGKRFYRSQRVLLNHGKHDRIPQLISELSLVVVEWNERSVEISLDIRAHFQRSYLNDFESLQSELAEITNEVLSVSLLKSWEVKCLLDRLSVLRSRYILFVQGMLYERRDLDRELYFGVQISYDRDNLIYWSTWELFKALFVARIQHESVLRSPSDLGMPQVVGKARARINEH